MSTVIIRLLRLWQHRALIYRLAAHISKTSMVCKNPACTNDACVLVRYFNYTEV